MNGDTTTCPTCDRTDFKTPGGMKRHHAAVHDERLGVKAVECDACGTEFDKRADHAQKLDHHFCDEDCEGEWRSDYLKGKSGPFWSRVETSCSQCDTEMTVEKSEFRRYERHFCDRECQVKWIRESRSRSVNKVTEKCHSCGESITRFPSKFPESGRQFCDVECRGEWLSGNTIEEGGYEGYYGPSWKESRLKRLKRDERECAVCGIPSDDHYEKYTCGLHVHHVIPFRKFGVEEHQAANRLSNLITVCISCHNKIEGWGVIPCSDEVDS
jgi:5-methylcytosine-specific restriction endonuclease McrA